MNPVKLIIFDLDGTLIDAYPAIIGSFNFCMKRLGYPQQPAAVIRRAVGKGDMQLLKPFVRPRDAQKALALYRAHHAAELREKARLYPGAASLLRQLRKRGYKLAVASNRPTKFSRIVLAHLGIRKYFDRVLCKDKLRYGKPHPLILNTIMRSFAVKPEETLYVGDMVIDAQAGRRAHVRTVVVTTGSSTRAELLKEEPFVMVPRIGALLDIPGI